MPMGRRALLKNLAGFGGTMPNRAGRRAGTQAPTTLSRRSAMPRLPATPKPGSRLPNPSSKLPANHPARNAGGLRGRWNKQPFRNKAMMAGGGLMGGGMLFGSGGSSGRTGVPPSHSSGGAMRY